MSNLLSTRELTGFEGEGSCTGDCGDTVEMFLRVRGGVIQEARFRIDGCLSTAMAAQTISEIVEGKELTDALQVNALDILDRIELGEEHEHCAVIATNALHSAVTDALRTQKEPWKQLYR